MRRERIRSGFTLLEVVVAVAIIAVIAGAMAPAVVQQITRARMDAAENELESIRTALEDFYEDTGRFPSEADGLGALVSDMSYAGWQGPYLAGGQADPVAEVTTDPFGQTYIYDLSPSVSPTGAADLIVASKGPNKSQDLGDGEAWDLSEVVNHDDVLVTLAQGPLVREKRRESVAELTDLIEAAKDYYRYVDAFPDSLAELKGDYIDAGYLNGNFKDGWGNFYQSTVASGGQDTFKVWSYGPDLTDDSGEDDDIRLVVNSYDVESEEAEAGIPQTNPYYYTELELSITQAAIDAQPGVDLDQSWDHVYEDLGLSKPFEKDEWDKRYMANLATRTVFSAGPDEDYETLDDNIPNGVGQ